jgi:hypothetical protein
VRTATGRTARPPDLSAGETPFAGSDSDGLRITGVAYDWTIDDAAWLIEAVCVSCSRLGIEDDIQVSVDRI